MSTPRRGVGATYQYVHTLVPGVPYNNSFDAVSPRNQGYALTRLSMRARTSRASCVARWISNESPGCMSAWTWSHASATR